jgi:hypothetical protein
MSGSMKPYTQQVIDGQFYLIDPLRKSHNCITGNLYVAQYLFSDKISLLHPFCKLSPTSGKDDVILFNSGNYYCPDGRTALYKSLYYILQDMAANISNAYAKHQIKAKFTLGVITDGDDTEGEFLPDDIKTIVQEFHGKGFLKSSVVVGITHSEFDGNMLEELKSRLGFQMSISVSRDSPDLRRAFGEPSSFALKSI